MNDNYNFKKGCSMKRQNDEFTPTAKPDYNKEPVVYCKKCLSLKIKRGYPDYCDECGSTELAESTIRDWGVLRLTRRWDEYMKSKRHGKNKG